MSPISSRKSVPPCAVSKRPARASTPVATPRSMPKSSDSSSVSGSAAQLMATNGLSARSLRAWIMRATSSLPVPLSPVRSTEIFDAATRETRSSTRRIAAESPTKSRPAAERPVSSSRRRFSSSSRSRSRVSRSRCRRFSIAMPHRPASDTRKRRSSSSKAADPPRRASLSARTSTPTGRPPPEIRTPTAAATGFPSSLNFDRSTAPSESRTARRNSSTATTASAGRLPSPTRASARRAPPSANVAR